MLAWTQVWRVQLDVRVLDAVGNVTDAAFLSVLAALMAFRRPEVSVGPADDGTQSALVVHSVEEREALPLSLHDAPLAVTFVIFGVSPPLSTPSRILCLGRHAGLKSRGSWSMAPPPGERLRERSAERPL